MSVNYPKFNGFSLGVTAAPTLSEFSGYGFAAGDVRGTRAWKVDRLGRLTGCTYPQIWRPGENLAECKRRRENLAPIPAPFTYGSIAGTGSTQCAAGLPGCNCMGGITPGGYLSSSLNLGGLYPRETVPYPCDGMDPECGCGFYAYQEGSNDYYKPSDGKPVGGVVRGYGKTVLGTRGFRAEKAEILALYINDGDVTGPGLKYRIERNYAGIPVFTDYAALLKEFPPTPPEGIGVPTDDDFWTRSAS